MSSRSERIEKIFERVEQECERRAQEPPEQGTSNDSAVLPAVLPARRRGGSISVSRFGESPSNSSEGLDDPAELPPPISSYVVRKPTFYHVQQPKGSVDSLASSSDRHAPHDPEETQVTKVATFSGRQSLSRTVGGILSRNMSRSHLATRDVLPTSSGVVIGVSVEEATVEAESHDHPQTSGAVITAYALGSLRRRGSHLGVAGDDQSAASNGWAKKAKDWKSKFRRRSVANLPQLGGAPE